MPQLETNGFKIEYTNGLWIVTMPECAVNLLEKITDKCHSFPYIEMGFLAALALLQSVAKAEMVCGLCEGFTKRKVNKAVLARKAQVMVGSPSERHFAELVSENCQ